MAVNENVYGASNTWINTAFYDKFYPNKKANFGDNTSKLSDGVTKGKLSYTEPIDKTIGYCGLGTECAISHIKYIAYSGGSMQIIDSTDRFQTNFAFFEITTQTGTDGNDPYFELNDMKYRHAWQSNTDPDTWWSYNKNKILEPYTLIHPKSVVFLVYVYAMNTAHTDSVNETLSQYKAQHTASYPHIVYAYIVPYMNISVAASETSPAREIYGAAGNITSNNRMGYVLGLLDEYDIPSKNFKMYSYQLQPIRVILGNINRFQTQEFASSIAICYVPESVGEHFKYSRVNIYGTNYIETYIEYYDGIIDEIMKSAACFGLYFTDKYDVARYGNFTNADMYIGLLDENGIGHGEYLRGANTANAPQNNWNDMTQSGYDYEKEVDKTKYRNDTQFYAGYGTSSFTKFYALTETQVNELSQELYRIANDVPTGTSITEYNMKMFLTNNPIDCIISLKKFPVENIPLASSDATIYLGAKATDITGKILATPTWVYYFNFRNSQDQSCRPIFGDNFLDYEPYTKCKIVIPFCGTVDVPVSYIYQYDDLQIALVMDFITGAVTAYVLVNGITIDSITGSCAIDLPVSGIQSATLDSQIHSVAMAREKQQSTLGTGLIAGAVSIGIGLATGSLPVAIGGGAAIIGSFMHADDAGKQINYELSHMETPVKQITAASGQIAHTYDMRCKMIITRPTIAAEYSAEEYANTIGFACLENGEVQQFHGLTVANIDLSGISCTAQEKEMIRAEFARGVYLPAEYSDEYWNTT